jgi:hypothetical protein
LCFSFGLLTLLVAVEIAGGGFRLMVKGPDEAPLDNRKCDRVGHMTPGKRKSPRRAFQIVTLFFMLGACAVSGDTFRLSFLDNESVLEDTCRLLRRDGFAEATVTTFRKLVESHTNLGNPVDRTKFPSPQDGYYQFLSINDFTNRLRCRLCDTPGKNSTLMCFDVACLLLKGAGYEAKRLEQGFDSKGIVRVMPDGHTESVTYTAFHSGIGLLFPANGYQSLVGRPRDETETQLGLALRAPRQLSGSYTNMETSSQEVFAEYVKHEPEEPVYRGRPCVDLP